MPCEIVPALGRRHRPSQLNVAPHLRAANVAGTMWLRIPPARLAGRLVIVIDDVATTGATLRAATHAITRVFKSATRQPAGSRDAKSAATSEPGHFESAGAQDVSILPVVWAAVLAVTEATERQKR